MKKASSNLLLLDLNVLLALAWPNHQFHAAATERLENGGERWATCALTELGFIRLSSNPVAVQAEKTPGEAATLLGSMVSDPAHVYLESLPSPAGRDMRAAFERILGSRQVMDVYLLRMAAQHKATFLTFDAKLKELVNAEDRAEILIA
jgi:toxin-antitoxin system PIN domain toxin